MYFLYSFLSVLSVLILIVPGFILRKLKLVSDGGAKDMSAVLLFVGIPALTFHCIMGVDLYEVNPWYILISALLAVVVHFVSYGVIKLVIAYDKDAQRKAAAEFSAIFSNCGFLGIPFTEMAINNCEALSAVADATVKEALFYVTVYNIVFNIITWTLGLGIFSKGEKVSVILKKALLSPVIIATAVGLPFLFAGISLFDPIVIGDVKITQIGDIIEYLYNICVPLSMVILGTRLADINIKDLFTSKSGWLSALVKLVITPLATLGIMLILNIFYPLSPAMLITFVVMAGTSTATNTLAFAETYNGDRQTSTVTILLSTILSVVTLPLILLLTVGVAIG